VATKFKDYLGNGVYVDVGSYPGDVILTTEDGVDVQNTIYLDPSILAALDRWRARIRIAAAQREPGREGGGDAPGD